MILAICDNSNVLSIVRIVKIFMRIITIAVPIILIVSSMLTLMAEMKNGDNDLVSKALKNIIAKTVAAILVFFIPTFVNLIDDIASANINYKSCLQSATAEGIEKARYDEAVALVEAAKKRITSSDYQAALHAVNKIKDEGNRQTLLDELAKIKKKVDLKDEVNRLLKTGTENDYNRLLREVNKLEDGELKTSLLATLEKMLKRIEEEGLASAERVLANITSYPPIKDQRNITLNYYVASNGQRFSFWLYLPDKMKSNLPMIFFMHDLGCRGDDYHNKTIAAIWGGPMREVMQKDKDWQAVIVHAQVPAGEYSQGYRYSYHELLEKLADGFKVDKKKISVMGFSNGCYGVWSIVAEYPDYFSAAVPIGCSAANVSPSIFKTTPMWSLVGSGDGASTMPGFATQVNALNGNSKHSFSQYRSHNCLYPAAHEGVLLEYNVVEWMLEQTKSK